MVEIKVEGMTCNHCVSKVTKSIKAIDKNAGVEIDLEYRLVRVRSAAGVDEGMKALDEAGYPGIRLNIA